MEPQQVQKITDRAPIVGWSSGTPTPGSTPSFRTPGGGSSITAPDTPAISLSNSVTSPDSTPSFRTAAGGSTVNVPGTLSTTPASIATNSTTPPPAYSDIGIEGDSDDIKVDSIPMNGIRKYHSTDISPIDETQILLIENPNYNEGVTFRTSSTDDSIMSTSSSSLSSDEIRMSNKKSKIPDGGWGWVVVFASVIESMIADGVSFSFGLLYIKFLEEFKASKATTSWIGSLFLACPLITGPIMSAIVDRYGCRVSTMIGGLVSALGFIICAFAESIEVVLLSFGVIAGLGLGLCYVTAVVSITYWFDKRRSLAVGIGACGTGIGTFVYAPMETYQIAHYGWRGCVLLLAGSFLNLCVCGALMRDPDWLIEENKQLRAKSTSRAPSMGSVSGGSNFPGVEEIRKLVKSGKSPEYILTALTTSMKDKESENEEVDKDTKKLNGNFRSVINLPTFVKQNETVPLEVLESLFSNKHLYNIIVENYPSLLLCRSISDKGLAAICEAEAAPQPARIPVTMSMRVKKSKQNKNENNRQDPSNIPLLQNSGTNNVKIIPSNHHETTHALPKTDARHRFKRQPSQTHHYLKDIKIHRNSVVYRGAMLNTRKYRLRATSCPDIYKNSMTTLAQSDEKWYTDYWEAIKGMADFSLFLELHFLLLEISTVLIFTWFIVPYFFLAEHLVRINAYTEEEASHFIAFIGVFNTIGMLVLGWAGDQPWIDVSKAYGVCMTICGVATIAMPWVATSTVGLGTACALFGLTFASTYTFTPIVLVELVSMERFTLSYGLVLLFQGIGNLIGPPIAGWLFDVTGSWEQSFYQAGVWLIVSGVFVGMISYTKNRRFFGSNTILQRADAERLSMA